MGTERSIEYWGYRHLLSVLWEHRGSKNVPSVDDVFIDHTGRYRITTVSHDGIGAVPV